MTRRTPAPLLAVSLALATALVACGEGDPSTVERPPGATSSTPAASPSVTTIPTASPSFDGTVVTIRVAGGRVETASREVAVRRGSRVRLEVTTDVADEVHVHVYDEKVATQPGVPAVLEFVADIPGIVEVELEKKHQLLVKLRVS